MNTILDPARQYWEWIFPDCAPRTDIMWIVYSPRALDWKGVEACRARMADPSYTRHDPYLARLAIDKLRSYDQIIKELATIDRDMNSLFAWRKRVASATIPLFAYDSVGRFIRNFLSDH